MPVRYAFYQFDFAPKFAVARAYSERIGSAAVMIVDDGVIVEAWAILHDVGRSWWVPECR